jgi:hypothetical protein
MKVRAAALNRFGENNIREGAPMATIEDVLVPLYLVHRYQVEAACKLVGGMDYTFALRGDGQTPTQIVPATEQRRALATVQATKKPEALRLPESLLRLIPPRPPGYPRGREHFKIRTSPAFDALAPAEAAARQSLRCLFSPERAARLVEFHARNGENPGLAEVLETILTATWKSTHPEGYDAQIANVVDDAVLSHLLALAKDASASEEARAIAGQQLLSLREWLRGRDPVRNEIGDQAHILQAIRKINHFELDPEKLEPTGPSEPPDGPPIGSGDDFID